jgi:DNA-binding GntR family transcriptional regulator
MSSTISARIFKEMESAILSGELKPRERLIEMDLIGKFGASRTVIREALKGLEAKGLVHTTPYRGAVVADLSGQEVEEIYFVRVAIEKIAARLVVKNITPQEIDSLKALVKEVEEHLRRKTDQMIGKDAEFHRAIYQTGRNQPLCEIIDSLKTKSYMVGYNAWSMPERIEQSIEEHREIVKAIEKRDAPRLEKVIVRHLTVSKNSYLNQLKGNERWAFKSKEKEVG